jgi:hypothetical protein
VPAFALGSRARVLAAGDAGGEPEDEREYGGPIGL